MDPFVLIIIVMIVGIGSVIALERTREKNAVALNAAERAELQRALEFVDTVKELAWTHRDVYPELSIMVIDEVQQFERAEKDARKAMPGRVNLQKPAVEQPRRS